MYFIIKAKSNTSKGFKVNKISKNAETIIIAVEQGIISLHNYDEFIFELSKTPIVHIRKHDESLDNLQIQALNSVELAKKISAWLKLTHDLDDKIDYDLKSDINWNDNGWNLPIRVTIPMTLILSNDNYAGLVGHVLGLKTIQRAWNYEKEGNMIIYFAELLHEHEELLSSDSNVLIERQ